MSTKGVGSVKIFPVWKPPNVTLFWDLIRLLQKSGPLLMPVNGVRKIALERTKARTWLKHVTKNANDTARKFAVAFSGQFLRSVYHWSKFYNLGYISLSKGYVNLSYLWVLESFFSRVRVSGSAVNQNIFDRRLKSRAAKLFALVQRSQTPWGRGESGKVAVYLTLRL